MRLWKLTARAIIKAGDTVRATDIRDNARVWIRPGGPGCLAVKDSAGRTRDLLDPETAAFGEQVKNYQIPEDSLAAYIPASIRQRRAAATAHRELRKAQRQSERARLAEHQQARSHIVRRYYRAPVDRTARHVVLDRATARKRWLVVNGDGTVALWTYPARRSLVAVLTMDDALERCRFGQR